MLRTGSRRPIFDRTRRAGLLALVLWASVPGTAAIVAAQPAPAKKATSAPAATQGGSQSSWVKLCEKIPVGTLIKDGKEETRYKAYCLTQHERIDGNTGHSLVTAAVRQMEGESKQYFMVMVPLGMLLTQGMRAVLYPKDLWERVQKNENVDESKLKGLKLEYTLCHIGGCTAETQTTPELIDGLKKFGGMVVFAINANGEAVAYSVAFAGFEQAYTGNPVDMQQYSAGRRALMQMIAQRQLADQQKKPAQPPAAAPKK